MFSFEPVLLKRTNKKAGIGLSLPMAVYSFFGRSVLELMRSLRRFCFGKSLDVSSMGDGRISSSGRSEMSNINIPALNNSPDAKAIAWRATCAGTPFFSLFLVYLYLK